MGQPQDVFPVVHQVEVQVRTASVVRSNLCFRAPSSSSVRAAERQGSLRVGEYSRMQLKARHWIVDVG